MNVRNCRKCGNLFNYVSGPPICMACREKLEEKFQEVKKYIQDNGHAGIQHVAEARDVSTNQIHQWLREERLELSAESGVTLSCENCGPGDMVECSIEDAGDYDLSALGA